MVNTSCSTKVFGISACIFILFAFSYSVSSALYLKKRSTSPQICSRSMPCGWEVYSPYIRTVDYFVASPCECPPNTECVRSYDDISISTYILRCRHQNEANSSQWPAR